MRKAVAFAPGHISGFFQPIINKENVNKTGSRGAGFCISHGVTASVKIKKNDKQKICIDNSTLKFPVTRKAVKIVIGKQPLAVTIDFRRDLPIGQGFGMSAACALSSSLAVAEILNKSRNDAIHAAHHAEVFYQTGLGDVVTSSLGGFEIRKKPGVFPFAEIQKIVHKSPIILGLFSGKIATKDILNDTHTLQRLCEIGSYCTDQVIRSPTVESIIKNSYYFTQKSKLASKDVTDVLEKINIHGLGSMCMLGNAVFAIGDDDKIRELLLSKQSDVIITWVDNKGARIVETSF